MIVKDSERHKYSILEEMLSLMPEPEYFQQALQEKPKHRIHTHSVPTAGSILKEM